MVIQTQDKHGCLAHCQDPQVIWQRFTPARAIWHHSTYDNPNPNPVHRFKRDEKVELCHVTTLRHDSSCSLPLFFRLRFIGEPFGEGRVNLSVCCRVLSPKPADMMQGTFHYLCVDTSGNYSQGKVVVKRNIFPFSHPSQHPLFCCCGWLSAYQEL